MKRVKHWQLWVGQGRELADTTFRGRPIEPDRYYISGRDENDGYTALAGPFLTEDNALFEVSSLTDTSGT